MLFVEKLFLWFLFYSFCGWVYESILVSILERRPVRNDAIPLLASEHQASCESARASAVTSRMLAVRWSGSRWASGWA